MRMAGYADRYRCVVCRMNPLNLVAERFVVASRGDGKVVGFCQLVEHGNVAELRSLFVEEDARCVPCF